ncbi:hypothetical protein IMZ38_00660 [Thermosphaera chiliense]|uniref:Uncharacterized protein n=1 Tax=Thermosphaera chiliense TaxID=3402707 RepID=A0A7M1UQH5_9CREN|nr:hypothetical protein [Thermosphaera aggregans]QOR94498.1 hypothetical protein IMZ38_00660 [Thermosphaera aggregans]
MLARIVLNLARNVFQAYAVLWLLKPRKASSMSDVFKLFYLDFLVLDEKHVEIVKLSDNELVTRCRNPCPILELSQRLRVDTRVSCRIVSEPVCKYVLNKLNPKLVFERNYEHIRPYADSCEERVYFGGTQA